MYDPIGEFFPPYGATVYCPPEDHPRAAPYEQNGWYDGSATPGSAWPSFPTVEALGTWDPEGVFIPHPRVPADEFAPLTANSTVPQVPRHRRRAHPPVVTWSQVISSLFGVLTAVTVTAMCLLGWTLSYDPLQDLALSRAPHGLSQLWPLIVYGPWIVGCLSVLRAALDGRRPLHSWVVVVLFSSVATGLCIADVSQTVPNVIVAGLPPITAVVSLHQLVRQLTAGKDTHRHAYRQASHKSPR
ncbi:DUF2637 domain-containing protein [Kitasatospora sp. GP82]|uniref:DUF2637 domain-containing protein n=1 Tax=Kitasatospora sp. GP82 TaxID=3035089 RepID=UPI0024751398|nr:DUF2637 domain-containing protein [Kitasatospora sp. GP82]MDH6123811.1 hypothetical protein [Kitasatospora sp. GP82]